MLYSLTAYALLSLFSASTIPQIDLADDVARQVTIDKESGQYLGHPTTVLLEDGTTILCVYPKGHGKGELVLRRSEDSGKTWSERLPTPTSWATSKETPHMYPVTDKDGIDRLILFSSLYPIRISVSEDNGTSWSELAPIGEYGGIVGMSDLIETGVGKYTAFFHDDGRFITKNGSNTGLFHVYAVDSIDGGLTWSTPRVVAHDPTVHLCEPGLVLSPDGNTYAMLLRENSRKKNSHICFSEDKGKTWSTPVEMPRSLMGDRHQAVYAEDGRLFISFRDTDKESETAGDWVAWVGTFEDLERGNVGAYRIRLSDNKHSWDCAYPGVELLPDGTIFTATYGHWDEGEQPYIRGVHLTLKELDEMLALDSRFHCYVLGRAQDGGMPHLGCEKSCCTNARASGLEEYPACLGIHDRETGKLLLIEATPAIESQVALLHKLSGEQERGRQPFDALLLTHAHIGHYAGLIQLGREVASTKAIPTFVTKRMANFLSTNAPWSQLVSLNQIDLQVFPETDGISTSFSPIDGLDVEAIKVPHRDEFSDTVAFKVRGPDKTVLFVPDIDRWDGHEKLLDKLLQDVDIAYIDATFYDGSELPNRDMSKIPHPMMIDTMKRLSAFAKENPGTIRFIHLNHSNPSFSDRGIQSQIRNRGFRIAQQGERIGL
jgi:phosphoribosyl 1,2-cyclic phosphodiesterase